ncbi:winged helix-turn-helix domain-containing protein [Pseudoteredinibacter isoporae]|uniref:DNA-binding winged helix-turn-helix (WHTH) protein/Tol biopolymer transport system component n=1 Tax=Pseudoteredinibacter isoporae TaxID=570281 RepID=A0A7X0JX70_9GAMM|nr:winged helix-turn-helix domain-containing protein [Pseudoteredinibacter isoporae]MBB6523867.1 DNA-binding winged helix-turn-helix (wHTH) protein/Tol biopolymer transport system component [Pseudoteredinibacter isoporae]NHO89384.1 hypothetical protein [Pseudoteredinibacter isoporae]NIB22491.1 hypothetical protein [Pseudoteredinibacter isoporae]
MQKCFWINGIQVDLSRNTINRDDGAFPLQPKVISVLKVLALHQGEVVSHDQLMDEVWRGATVSPNTLQRCIAQLRKVLKDNSRTQQVIKTHSKLGYSLEASVNWEDSIPSEIEFDGKSPFKSVSSGRFYYPAMALAAAMLLIWLVYGLAPGEPSLNFRQSKMLTTSDEKEYFPDYSPDGRYLVFHRYLGACENHLWAKDLKTHQEYRLTRTSGIYANYSWSTDGNQLAFIKREGCQQQSGQEASCWRLYTLDFAQALRGPLEPVQRLDCDTHLIDTPVWANNGNILLLKEEKAPSDEQGQLRLMVYDVRTTQLKEFYRPKQGRLYDFTYSNKLNRFAVITKGRSQSHFVELLDGQGQLLERSRITPLESHSRFQSYSASFHPNGEFLITNLENGLHQMSLGGELRKIETPYDLALSAPRFHPIEQKIVATSGVVDIDIAEIELAALASRTGSLQDDRTEVGFNEVHLPFPSISRSIRKESHARFQPNGERIAFVSQRSGSEQLWIYHKGESRQLSRFNQSSSIRGLEWSPDGQHIAVGIRDTIVLVDLNGNETPFVLNKPIRNLFQWASENQLLALAGEKSSNQLLTIDAETREISRITDVDVKFARQYKGGFLMMDVANRLWHLSKDERRAINVPFNMLGGNPVLSGDGSLYGISHDAQLWRFDLEAQQIEMIAAVDENVWWLMDVKEGYLLAAQAISARKEIVELSPQM